MTEKNDVKIKDIIGKADKLGWISPIRKGKSYPEMQLSEVEKCMFALLDNDYMKQIDRWIEEKARAR